MADIAFAAERTTNRSPFLIAALMLQRGPCLHAARYDACVFVFVLVPACSILPEHIVYYKGRLVLLAVADR